ncbi:MAG: biotin--[acetyl-CoA-carboxylase] ligase [Bdellovibrionales bacterium]|nr:biotin--[acetyl-CoA-carboxylase] ligase [Bdellovibrionales bacterium]
MEEFRIQSKESALSNALERAGLVATKVAWLTECGSTMDVAKEYLKNCDDAPLAVFTERQTAGRGRNGSTWLHATDGLAGTVVLRSFATHRSCLGLSLVVGIALAELFDDHGVQLSLKWPNDLLTLEGEKVGGILIEIVERDGKIIPMIGIGLNLLSGPDDVFGAGGLHCPVEISVFAASLIERLQQAVLEFAERGFAPFRDRFLHRAAYCGEEVEFFADGAERRGRMIGVSHEGALEVQVDQRLCSFHSADRLRGVGVQAIGSSQGVNNGE